MRMCPPLLRRSAQASCSVLRPRLHVASPHACIWRSNKPLTSQPDNHSQSTHLLCCSSGTASSTIGAPDASYCIPCATGFYSANNGSTTCTPCAAGAHTAWASNAAMFTVICEDWGAAFRVRVNSGRDTYSHLSNASHTPSDGGFACGQQVSQPRNVRIVAEGEVLLAGTFSGDTGSLSCGVCPAGEHAARRASLCSALSRHGAHTHGICCSCP